MSSSPAALTGCAYRARKNTATRCGCYDFLLARNAVVNLKPIAKPESKFKSLVSVFEKSLEQEERVTGQIDALYELAFKEKQFAALVELEWFITEQVEEEKTAREVVHKFHLGKDDPTTLLDLDRELGSRAPKPTRRSER